MRAFYFAKSHEDAADRLTKEQTASLESLASPVRAGDASDSNEAVCFKCLIYLVAQSPRTKSWRRHWLECLSSKLTFINFTLISF